MPSGSDGPDAPLIAALDGPVGRAVLAALRSGPRTVADLVATTGHGEDAVWAALHALTDQGVVTADHPRLPGEVAYRIDSAALTGFRGLGRWFRSRSSAVSDGRRSTAGHADGPASADDGSVGPSRADAEADAGGIDAPSDTTPGSSAARSRPSVAAWTNPAVKAALQRLEEQQRRPR